MFDKDIFHVDAAILTAQTIDTLIEDFEFLDDWEDRYRFVIELGKALPPFAPGDKTAATKVEGCVSQVWLKPAFASVDGQTILTFTGDSDAHIVRGLIAILAVLYSGKRPGEILAIDAGKVLRRIGLDSHLTPQRSNGLQAMVHRIRSYANSASAARQSA